MLLFILFWLVLMLYRNTAEEGIFFEKFYFSKIFLASEISDLLCLHITIIDNRRSEVTGTKTIIHQRGVGQPISAYGRSLLSLLTHT